MNPFFSWQQAILKSSLEPTTKLVCFTIACHMAMDGTGCFPSYALIAEESGLGRSTVIAHVQKAVDAGYLMLAARVRDNGSSSSNLYQPVMPQVVQQRDGGSPATGPGVVQQLDPHNTPSLTPQLDNPSVSPQPTKAIKRATLPLRSLEEFLEPTGVPPAAFGDYARRLGWDAERSGSVWERFARYWRSPDAKGGGRKRDWLSTWQNWCDREAENGGRGGGNGTVPDRGLAAAMRSSFHGRNGAAQSGETVGGGQGADTSGADGGGTSGRLVGGEIPF